MPATNLIGSFMPPANAILPPSFSLELAPDLETARLRAARVRIGGWALALILGLIAAWLSRHTMNADGLSYLDIADAYLIGDWSAAINPTWSPLFSWVIAAATVVVKPSAYWEFTMVHLVNFLVYAVSLLTFELALTELIRARNPHDAAGGPRFAAADEWAWRLLGYSLFIWSGLEMIGLTMVTPDMGVAALVYLATALLLRLRDPRASHWLSVGVGITLAFGYLAKAVMFPLAFVFMASGLIAWRIPRSVAVRRAVLTGAAFGAVAAPYAIALSVKQGYPTWGSVSKLVYAWCIDGATETAHCGTKVERNVVHETRQISREPAVYEFASPIPGSYPPFYDPSYWFGHVRSRFMPFRMVARMVDNGLEYLRWVAPLVAALGVVFWVNARTSADGIRLREYAPLTLPSAAAVLLYTPVYIDQRYVGPFFVLLTLGAFAGLRSAQTSLTRVLFEGAAVTLFVALVTRSIVSGLFGALSVIRHPTLGGPSAHAQWQVADGLRAVGLRRGDAVAVIGWETAPYWARLARVRVVAQIPTTQDANAFWASDSTVQSRVTSLLATTGARAVVAKQMPSWTRRGTWQPLGSTGYYVLVFDDSRRGGL